MLKITHSSIFVLDQDEALDFYVGKLGFKVHTDARNGNYRWLTVKHPNQPSFELGLFLPQESRARRGDGAYHARNGSKGRNAAACARRRRLSSRL